MRLPCALVRSAYQHLHHHCHTLCSCTATPADVAELQSPCWLQEVEWRVRESAILALGAISEGCANGLLPHLEDMVTMLLPKVMTTPCSRGVLQA